MKENRVKKMLAHGQPVIGSLISVNCPDVVEVMALAGFDFLLLDLEHSPMSVESSVNLIRAAELHGVAPITRTTDGSPATILRSLDVGAYGIQVPQVNTAGEAARIVKAARYYPAGERGAMLPRASNYGAVGAAEYFLQANRETLVVVQCESARAVENLPEILKTGGIDVLFVGPFDLSVSKGHPGQMNHPEVQAAIDRCLGLTLEAGVAAGIFATDGEQAARRIRQGFRYVAVSLDLWLLSRACRDEIGKVKGS
ncbi:MAG: HpcH/HpaI aldolase family protein [Bacillota bacterium]